MKKNIVLLCISLLLLTACSLNNKDTPTKAVEKFFDQYRNLSANVLTDLERVINKEDFNDEQAALYRDVLKKQYSDLKYKIVNESYDGNTSKVEVKITVYDLYKVQSDATMYMSNNQTEFVNDSGVYDNNLFLNYKLDKMLKNTDTVEYTLSINVDKKDDGLWYVRELTQQDLEKIHGVYNYDK